MTLDLFVEVSVWVRLFSGALRIDDGSWHQTLLFSASQDVVIQSLLLLSDQSFLESHLVLSVKHLPLHLEAIILVTVLAELLVLLIELLNPIIPHVI